MAHLLSLFTIPEIQTRESLGSFDTYKARFQSFPNDRTHWEQAKLKCTNPSPKSRSPWQGFKNLLGCPMGHTGPNWSAHHVVTRGGSEPIYLCNVPNSTTNALLVVPSATQCTTKPLLFTVYVFCAAGISSSPFLPKRVVRLHLQMRTKRV